MPDPQPAHTNGLTLDGRVERVTFSSSETGYAVLRIRPRQGGRFTAVGHIPELLNQAGLDGADLRFTGQWTVNKYGRQFAFTQCQVLGSELLFFLVNVVKGLGPRLARELIDRYGEAELVAMLDADPRRLLEVKGIKEKRLSLILKSWHKHRSLKALAEYLGKGSCGVTPNLLVRIYNHFGEDAPAVVRENPYRLTEVRGIGFRTADRIAMGLGIGPDSPERIEAALTHILLEAGESDGHCHLDHDELVQQVREAIASEETLPPEDIVEGGLSAMILRGDLVRDDSGATGLVSYRNMEDWLRGFFLERTREEGGRPVVQTESVAAFLQTYERKTGFELSDEQREIVFRVATEPRRVFALAGYAGTGKTTVCRAVLELLALRYAPRDEIVCCAFTGMAASRIRKATGFDAFTIHSLLKYSGDGSFEHGPEKPLPYRVVVLDEASMVSLPLFYRLARALQRDTLFLLVGDPAQLPPIGAGNVFGDAVANGLVTAVHLTRIYRQSGDSVLALFANEIRVGRMPEGVKEHGWKDFVFEEVEHHNIFAARHGKTEREVKALREENNAAIQSRILDLAREYKGSLTHPVWDFQVLTPMKMGQLGTEVLNPLLQEILNPAEKDAPALTRSGITVRTGDKLVHLQNRDMAVMAWDAYIKNGRVFEGAEYRRIFNGNVGLVQALDPEAGEFHVVYPERIVVAYDIDHLGDIVELAYALTVHKAQGSQYRIVAIPLTNSHFIMLNTKWFYTAITRAEEKVHLVGQPYALKRACTNVEGVARRTWLALMGPP